MGSPRTARDGNGISRLGLPESSVLVFDVDAAGLDGAAAPARRCEVKLLGVTRDADGAQRSESSKASVSAVLVLRALSPARLLSCVRAVTEGGADMPPEVLCQMLPESGNGASRERLTDREFDVLRLLADGDSTRDIAKRLSYSERTVKNIVHDLLVKLNCRTRAHAVALATRRGVI
jgi:DNA-binding NarL/FixJ family response regulator